MADGYWCYTGKLRDCGCLVAVVVDEPGYEKDTAKSVSAFIKDGYIVERVRGPVQLKRCEHKAATA